jgi:Trypsin-like peptidase domain
MLGRCFAIILISVYTIISVQSVLATESSVTVNRIAKSITVQIQGLPPEQGSGVLLQRKGQEYTILTAAHAVRNKIASYIIITPDGKRHSILPRSLHIFSDDIDLATFKISSSNSYSVAKLGESQRMEEGMDVYISGFPRETQVITNSTYVFREGKVSANASKPFAGGYSLLYSNDTLPGMSGGAVLNDQGELIAIHGKGDRTTDAKNVKTGFNAGIPISTYLAALKVDSNAVLSSSIVIPTPKAPNADDFFVSSQNRDSSDAVISDLTQAISLKPNYASAYYARGTAKLGYIPNLSSRVDYLGALSDYSQAISLRPNYTDAYYMRGLVRQATKNRQGALTDYNQVIYLDQNYAAAYFYRGVIKYQLNDSSGSAQDLQIADSLAKQQRTCSFYRPESHLLYPRSTYSRTIKSACFPAVSIST